MYCKSLISLAVASAVLTGCSGGGDVNLSPSNVNNSVDNSVTNGGNGGNGSSNPCASYLDPATNQTEQGTFDGTNCNYDAGFVGESNPLTVDLEIPLLANGVHIFQDSLFVGEEVNNSSTGSTPGAAVLKGGEGPTLTIAAGNTLVFTSPSDYIRISRGSQIIARGTAVAPITLTAFSDAVTGTAPANAVSLWGGLQINGNGITNKCTNDERTNGTCAVESEGQPSLYGGNDNTDNSGVLEYVVVKHSGFAVVEGDELNGITFNAVGSGTTVNHIEVFSTYDDGLEFFGGAVNIKHFIGVNVRDDSLDFSDGYVGKIQYALIIHERTAGAENGNRCIEADNISSSRVPGGATPQQFLVEPLTAPTIANVTCITSGADEAPNGTGTHGDSEGFLWRVGFSGDLYNSIAVSGAGGNELLEFDDDGTKFQVDNNVVEMAGVILAGSEPTANDTLLSGTTFANWFVAESATNLIDTQDAQILNGIYTRAQMMSSAGTAITTVIPTDLSADGFFDATGFVGAVTQGNDWTAGWSFGIPAL